MKERPILFSAPMVRALLAGRKQQTRRILKPQPQMVQGKRIAPWEGDGVTLMRLLEQTGKRCPYGQPGDRLWVRESWGVSPIYDNTKPRDLKPRGMKVGYAADDGLRGCKTRPSIHMPRWAGRITLEVTGVRVERLQDISEADALAEGVSAILDEMRRATPRCDFQALWQSINGPDSWAANPWVWVIEFKRIKP